MFLGQNYILANELVEKMGISIANISMLRKQFEEVDDDSSIIKMNNCSFIKKNSSKLPHNILAGIASNEFTDVSNKLPVTWVREEFEITEKEWFKSGLVIDKIKISSKQFYVFDDEFVQTVKGKVTYVLNEQETLDCFNKGLIQGYRQVSKNKFITWYSIKG